MVFCRRPSTVQYSDSSKSTDSDFQFQLDDECTVGLHSSDPKSGYHLSYSHTAGTSEIYISVPCDRRETGFHVSRCKKIEEKK